MGTVLGTGIRDLRRGRRPERYRHRRRRRRRTASRKRGAQNQRHVLLLDAAPTIKERIQNDGGRPSITGKKSFIEEVEEVLEARLPLYEAAADYVIRTDNRTLGEIADEIVEIACTAL